MRFPVHRPCGHRLFKNRWGQMYHHDPVPVGCSKVVRDHRQVREASS